MGVLTDSQIKRAIKDVATEVTLNDKADGHGGGSLRLRIRRGASGVTATWLAFWKVDGKRATKTLGTYPDMPLSLARQKFADEVRPVLKAGKNPRVTVAKTDQPTVQRLFEGYVASMKDKARESAGEVERMLLTGDGSAAAVLGRTRLAGTVDADDVVDYVSRFYRRGFPGAADKARSYVHSAFAWAIKSAKDYTREDRTDWGVKHNPAADVPRDTDATGTRERALAAKELATLWAALDGDGFTLETASCVRLLICLGQRVQETLRVDGCEIDLDAATWNMPREKTKLKLRPHTIPLPAQAVEVFRQLKAKHGDGPLFPGRKNSKAARIQHRSINQALGRWLAEDDVTVADFQTRDLRRTWKSRAGEIGISKELRDLIQQHAKTDTGSVNYDRADYLPQMREAMNKWEAWLGSNVVNKQQHNLAA